MDLSDIIDRNAEFAPDHAAIHYQGETLNYQDFCARISATARALKSVVGMKAGDRLAILAANHPDYLVLLYACARLGVMLVPLNWRLAAPELQFIVSDARPRALVIEQAFAEMIPAIVGVLPEICIIGLDFTPSGATSLGDVRATGGGIDRNQGVDFDCPLLIAYTSGTTGRPKGAVLRQEALVWNAAMSQHMHSLTADDHVLTVLPLFHVGGLNIQTTPALQIGATITLHRRFAPDDTLDAIAAMRPTRVALIPATIQPIVEHTRWNDADLSSLRSVTTGSTTVPQTLVDAVTARGIPVLQVYGSTETCPIVVYTRLGSAPKADAAGRVGLFCELRIVDDRGCDVPNGKPGEILVRSPNLFSGYWDNQQATGEVLRDGWFHTGDIGSRDHDGHVFIHERKNNLIISGGENVYPAEIEQVLLDHPGVDEAAVIGLGDPVWQEVPIAYVVKRAGVAVDADALRDHAARRLARYKIPREFIFIDNLPRNAMGKVQYFLLREHGGAS